MKVGQPMWYFPFVSHFMETGPRAAIVAKVVSEEVVNLTVFDQHGVSHARQNVVFVGPAGKVPANAEYCLIPGDER